MAGLIEHIKNKKMTNIKEIKAWAVVDFSCGENDLFSGTDNKFHIFKTNKSGNAFIKDQFFYSDELKWKVIKIKIKCLKK